MAYPINDHTYKIAAGWLIEACGWKGNTRDQVGCYKDKGKTILDFFEAIVQSVQLKFGVELKSAIHIL
jgi:UDP-N-acetylmuramate dehydrogenase